MRTGFMRKSKSILLLANHDEVLLFGSRMQHLYNALKNDLNYTKKIQHYDDKNEIKKEIEKIKIKQELKGLRTGCFAKSIERNEIRRSYRKGDIDAIFITSVIC